MRTRGDSALVRVPLPIRAVKVRARVRSATPAAGLAGVPAGEGDDMAGPTRGFLGRRRERDPRLPPGQYDVGRDWPGLTAAPAPPPPPPTRSTTVPGRVEDPTTWTWDEAHRLPRSEYRGDIHCVTTWSKFDTWFAGVSVDTLLEAAQPTEDAHFVLATSKTGYP